MSWNVIVRVGYLDQYTPDIPTNEPRIFTSIDNPGSPFLIKNNLLTEILDKAFIAPSSEVVDLLNLGIAIYTADLKIQRNLSEDRWTRDFIIHIPVLNQDRWTQTLPHLEEMLNFLTGDSWQFRLRQRQQLDNWEGIGRNSSNVDTISLFSGGLDSLIGAIDLLEEGKDVALVGHYGAGITRSIQQLLLSKLQATYGKRITPFLFYVQPPKRGSGKGEPSMRSRSILFLVLGTLVANLFPGQKPLVVAENGLISLNVPLTHSRIGSLSTRTTHPHFLSLYQKILSSLGLVTSIELPYKFFTKGEMLANVKNKEVLESTANLSMSCSHPEAGRFRQGSPSNHCGYCVPCIIRRAALASVQLDNCMYSVDILKNPPAFDSKMGRDFRAFQMAIERLQYAKPHSALFNVLSSGPLPPDDVKNYADVYLRGMEEVRHFFSL